MSQKDCTESTVTPASGRHCIKGKRSQETLFTKELHAAPADITGKLSSPLKAAAAYSPKAHSARDIHGCHQQGSPRATHLLYYVRKKRRAKFSHGHLVPTLKCTLLVGSERAPIPTDFKWARLWEISKPHAASKHILKVIHESGHDLGQNSALACHCYGLISSSS